jgi:hypothetical protein
MSHDYLSFLNTTELVSFYFIFSPLFLLIQISVRISASCDWVVWNNDIASDSCFGDNRFNFLFWAYNCSLIRNVLVKTCNICEWHVVAQWTSSSSTKAIWKSSWTHVITPTRNFVEARWRSLFRSTSLGKRCTSYNAPSTSRKRAADRLTQASGGYWNGRFWTFTFVSPSLKRFHHLKAAARLTASSPLAWWRSYRILDFNRTTLTLHKGNI